MYNSKETETIDKAHLIIAEINRALSNGTKHFRKSDGKFLETPAEILRALADEGELVFEPLR